METKDTSKQKETMLVIPYLLSGAQGGELETAVNGWIRNYTGALRIVVIGDMSHVVAKLQNEGKVEFIPAPRSKEHSVEPALDIAAKMSIVIGMFGPEYKGCIWSNDDIYPVNRITMKCIRSLKIIADDMGGNPDSDNHFQRNMYRTRETLRKAGKPTYNYCVHLPAWYDFARLSDLLDEYRCEEVPHLISCLYFNHYYTKERCVRINVPASGSTYKFGVYSRNVPVEDVRKAMESGVLFVNNSNGGWSKELILAVRRHNQTNQL